jgi:hypothetical protein
MTEKQKQGVKQAALELYQARRMSLKMAVWAMKNAGYTREETEDWLRQDKVNAYEGRKWVKRELSVLP